jgi:hypothetical protein
MKSGTPRTMRAAAAVMTLAALTSGCAATVASADRTVCRELRLALPTWAEADTEQSKREGADFLDVFEAVCPEG